MVETVEHLVIGAGPAGLRAAQVLATSGREVLVLERHVTIGPKTCAGGLTRKAVRELEPLGLPPGAGLESVGHVAFAGGRAAVLDAEATRIRTIPRGELGALQLAWTTAAGAEIRAGCAATRLDLRGRTVEAGGRTIRFVRLIGADGADSAVRRALGLPGPREYFAAEFNVPRLRLAPLRVECDATALANGYFWVFPHCDYTSIGAVAPKALVRPAAVRRYLERRAARLGVSLAGVPFEGATLEVQWRGFDFPGGVHLVGDAAGVPSALTAEGIYAALITGEETARRILEARYPSPKSTSWLRVKRRHDALARMLRPAATRAVTLRSLGALARWHPAARRLAAWFLAA
ncbi:MAG TPA: NAD(P)/FAD-dependent oxidoreductase [Gemmatimonadales bacterium]|nr:NAD(P)/FAD-dependent oxidoreductase [Gemmatimonadales bacterium]